MALVFVVWDALAIAGQIWTFHPQYVTGIELLFGLPLEEVLFFVVVPLCKLLTFNAVNAVSDRGGSRRQRTS